MVPHGQFQWFVLANISLLRQLFGNWNYKSNGGKKDLYIDGKLTTLYHIVPNFASREPLGVPIVNNTEKNTGAYVMFCLPEKKCVGLPLEPFAKARILQYNMPENQDWSFINTAEI